MGSGGGGGSPPSATKIGVAAEAGAGGIRSGGGGGSPPSTTKTGAVAEAGAGGIGGGAPPSATVMIDSRELIFPAGARVVSTPNRIKLPSRNKKTSVFLNFMVSSIRFEIEDPPVENGPALRIQLREAFPRTEGATDVAWDSKHSGKKDLRGATK